MTRAFFLIVLAVFAVARGAMAQPTSPPSQDSLAPYEVVKDAVDLEADREGHFWEVAETRYRPLTLLGLQALQKITLNYTADYQRMGVLAYTLKKDGRKIEVAQDRILQGHGQTTRPGFADTRTLTIVFQDLEVGDQAVVMSKVEQVKPLLPDVFAVSKSYPRTVAVREATFALTTRGDDAAFHITASGVDADPAITGGGKTRHVWHYRSDTPAKQESNAVDELSDQPHIEVTTLTDYAALG